MERNREHTIGVVCLLASLHYYLKILIHRGFHFTAIEEIWTIEAGDERFGVVQVEAFLDIDLNSRCGCGGQSLHQCQTEIDL